MDQTNEDSWSDTENPLALPILFKRWSRGSALIERFGLLLIEINAFPPPALREDLVLGCHVRNCACF